jgi:hypothetical protein
MTLRLSTEERHIVLTTLRARLDAVQAEMTRTDSPGFSLELKREERMIRDLVERLGPLPGKSRPARTTRGGRPRARRGAGSRSRRSS